MDDRRVDRVMRTARLMLGMARFHDPKIAVIATAMALGRLCRTHCPTSLDPILQVVRDSFSAA